MSIAGDMSNHFTEKIVVAHYGCTELLSLPLDLSSNLTPMVSTLERTPPLCLTFLICKMGVVPDFLRHENEVILILKMSY
jgi:hypothetical protein